MTYDFILFDLDGTITDSKEGITKCVQYALKHIVNIDEPDLEKLRGFVGPPLVDSFKEFYGFEGEKAAALIKKYRERFGDVGLFENRVYEGAVDMLKAVRAAGKKTAIATSKQWEYTERILERYELRSYFDVVVGSEMDGRRIKKAEVVEEVLRQFDIKGEMLNKALMVGDRKHDVIGAKACGLSCLGVRYGYAEPGELEAAGADFIVATMDEVKEFIINH